jgi:hypothetical protein
MMALECLRGCGGARHAVYSACSVLDHTSGPLSVELRRAVRWVDRAVQSRLLRARLALALRVLLRAGAGDFGPAPLHGCYACFGTGWNAFSGVDCRRCGRTGFEGHRVRPLWESAPPHEVSR